MDLPFFILPVSFFSFQGLKYAVFKQPFHSCDVLILKDMEGGGNVDESERGGGCRSHCQCCLVERVCGCVLTVLVRL